MRHVEFNIGGDWVNTADLTGEELEAIEAATKSSWYVVMTNPFASMVFFRAIAGAFLLRKGLSDEDAKTIIGSMTARQINAAARYAEKGEDLPDEYEGGIPLVAAAPSTPTSSSAPSAGTGPLT